LIAPLKDSWVTPNHLTTLRLIMGLAAAVAFTAGNYIWTNTGALLLVLSNFLDHTDGELARLSGKSSRFGHFYDLASDGIVTTLLFVAIGIGVGKRAAVPFDLSPVLLGAVAGVAVTIIFYLRLRIEEVLGKGATQQASLGGFETEDILYLMPLATLSNGTLPLLLAASICAPLYAVWVTLEYCSLMRRD
jgi:phosphatidylglycerophosphate synthase